MNFGESPECELRLTRGVDYSSETGLQVLNPDDEIVLYDSGPPCPASRMACRFLRAHGYERVRRYAPGLKEWESAGHPQEGEHVV